MSGDLEQRVAALEAALDRLQNPPVIAEFPPMSDEDKAKFIGEFETALRDISPDFHAKPILIPPLPPDSLSPETVRLLLRESVTIVKPGEVLFFSCGDPNMTPNQIRDLEESVTSWLDWNAPEVKALVLPYGTMAVAAPE